MSVTIHYRIKSKEDPHFQEGVSDDLMVLERVFPGGHIEPSDVITLRAMAIATRTEFFNEVAETVNRVGAIEVYGKW